MQGQFVYATVPTRWRLEKESVQSDDAGASWVLDVRIADVSIRRHYSGKISRSQAARDANAIAPMPLPIRGVVVEGLNRAVGSR